MYTKAFKRLEGLARLRMHGVGHFMQTPGAGVAGARGGAFGQHRIAPGRVMWPAKREQLAEGAGTRP